MINTNVIDRRKNAKNKSVGIRQKFIKRAKNSIKKAINDAIDTKAVTDIYSDSENNNISIPIKDIKEPIFSHGDKDEKDIILPGNKKLIIGDTILKPKKGSCPGGGGSKDGEGDDDFRFTLTREEFLDFFFEDLELPDLIKTQLKEIKTFIYTRAGYTTTGSPNNLDILKTMKNSLGRRMTLSSPYDKKIKELEDEIQKLFDEDVDGNKKQIVLLMEEIKYQEELKEKIPFVDDIDVRYRSFRKKPKPKTQAVMFCIMDVSGSMGEYEKNLAKRFFMLLYIFLIKKYESIDVIFIRHHSTAKECNEQDFFYGTDTGGTIVSTALELVKKIIDDKYNLSSWNIYIAQVSDGDNFSDDTDKVRDLLNNIIMPLVQYYAYIQISKRAGEYGVWNMYSESKNLWTDLAPLKELWKNFNMEKISTAKDIFPVFRKLFKKKTYNE